MNPTCPTKILVAVHGIGDQIGYATVQSVVEQVGAYYNISAAIPLGRFYPGTGGPSGGPMPVLMVPPQDPVQFRGIGFAEVYWAEIPRNIVKAGHILEETKKWARTVSVRLAAHAASQGAPIPLREQVRLTTVLDELIETVAVLERLNFVLAKAGLVKFSLNQLLTDFVGDVQIVVDFQAYREEILAAFDTVMAAALKLADGQPVELHLVAHSEGSVLTFMALLNALAAPHKHPWIQSVRGLMTIGSPIEVHHLLWPELWHRLAPDPKLAETPFNIPWRNYYDYGDPIAYGLESTGRWLKEQGFDRHLQLTDIAFGRSFLPGKAHVDYWADQAVFGHFIDTVVRPPEPCPRPTPAPVPGTRWTAVAVGYAVPQVLIAALLCLATYFFYRPVAGALAKSAEESLSPLGVAQDVLGIALLLLGITAAARIPRLTNMWRWWLLAAVLLVVSMVTYEHLVLPNSRGALGIAFIEAAHRNAPAWTLTDITRATRGVQIAAGVLALASGFLASWWPAGGVRLLPWTGLVVVLLLVGRLLMQTTTSIDVWPAVLGAACFFYFWWVAALFFDLVFVWHRYIRHAVALRAVAEVARKGYVP